VNRKAVGWRARRDASPCSSRHYHTYLACRYYADHTCNKYTHTPLPVPGYRGTGVGCCTKRHLDVRPLLRHTRVYIRRTRVEQEIIVILITCWRGAAAAAGAMNLKSERHVNFAPEINPRLITLLSLSLSFSWPPYINKRLKSYSFQPHALPRG